MKAPIDNFVCESYPRGSVTQWFGENKALYSKIGLIGHNGIDIVAPWGSPIYAVEGGIVCDVNNDPKGYGKHCRILSPSGIEWIYGHASENLVKVGQQVEAGQMIQKMGNTGFVISGSTPYWKYNPYAGTHLHLGARRYKNSKMGFRYQAGSPLIEIENHNNGYYGSFDIKSLLKGIETSQPTDTEQQKTLMLSIISLLNQIISKLHSYNKV